MKKWKLPVVPLLMLFTNVACTTYSRTQCEGFDWKAEGYGVALKGQKTSEGLAHFNKECGEIHDVIPNTADFKQGYELGNKEFCTEEHAKVFGLSGGEYRSGLCPEQQESKILKPYVEGMNLYCKQRVSDLETEVGTKDSIIGQLQARVTGLEAELASCGMR